MIFAEKAHIKQLVVHHVGNKQHGERFVLSNRNIDLSDEMRHELLKQFFTQNFQKQHEVYRFFHPNDDLNLNEVYTFAHKIFKNEDAFIPSSVDIAKYLYQVTEHPNIKSGEMYVALFDEIQIEGEAHQALGIFKSETKDSYLKVYPAAEGFEIDYEQDAISIHKLDKGCLIFNTEHEEGFKVLVLDQASRNQEAVYWKDDFLGLKVRNDNYQKTHQFLNVYKQFVTENLEESFEVSKADQIDLMNKSMKYFKENENFSMQKFGDEVIANPHAMDLFVNFKQNFEQEFDFQIEDEFAIATEAVKKQSRIFKSVLKLDKNFHIYIHGDKNKIEKGFDDERGLNYYKVFFDKEL